MCYDRCKRSRPAEIARDDSTVIDMAVIPPPFFAPS